MIKVLYCHGMGGEGIQNPKILQVFKSHGIDLISPTINYELFINNPYIFDTMGELADDADIIIGNSMGGYFSYHLGKAFGKPSLCFNPAISEVTTSYNWFNSVTNYEPHDDQKNTLIYMSTKDLVVDHEEGKKFLDNNGFKTDTIEYLEGMNHSLSFEFMFYRILDFAISEMETMEE